MDIAARIERDWSANEQASVVDLLMTGVVPFDARVVRCILHLAGGNTDKLLHYCSLAHEDVRDLIYWAEYDRDGHRVHDFREAFE